MSCSATGPPSAVFRTPRMVREPDRSRMQSEQRESRFALGFASLGSRRAKDRLAWEAARAYKHRFSCTTRLPIATLSCTLPYSERNNSRMSLFTQIKQPSIVSYRSPFSCHDKLQFLSCLSGGPSSLSSSATLTQCRCPRAPLVLWQFQTGKASSREVLFKLLLGARKKWPDRLFVVLLLMHAMRPLQTDKGETRHPATPLKHARDVGSTHKPSIANSGRRTGVVCVVPVSDGRQFATLCRPGSVVAAAKSKPVALALARQAKVRSWEVITWRHQV